MAMQIWTVYTFDKPITAVEDATLRMLFNEEADADALDEFSCSGECLTAGWMSSDENDLLASLVQRVLPGHSACVERDFKDCGWPGIEKQWTGPRAAELEIEHINAEIMRLAARKAQLQRKAGQ